MFLMRDETVKLGDFGVHAVVQHLSSRVSSPAGTFPYYSPEMCRGERYGEKADVWALGCVVYELTTLSHPFHRDGDNMMLLSHRIRRGKYDPIPSFYSEQLSWLIQWLLSVDVAQILGGSLGETSVHVVFIAVTGVAAFAALYCCTLPSGYAGR